MTLPGSESISHAGQLYASTYYVTGIHLLLYNRCSGYRMPVMLLPHLCIYMRYVYNNTMIHESVHFTCVAINMFYKSYCIK